RASRSIAGRSHGRPRCPVGGARPRADPVSASRRSHRPPCQPRPGRDRKARAPAPSTRCSKPARRRSSSSPATQEHRLMSYVPLSWLDLTAAAVLIVFNGVLSWALRLGLERSIAIATLRMVVQLGAIGFVLKLVFEQTSPLLTAVLALVMVAMAGHEALARQEARVGGWMAYGIGTGTLFFVGLLA